MTGPFVSVILSTYQRRSQMLAALASALAQEAVQVEVLVCDDGSNDGSREAVAGLNDPRVRWVPGAHAGRPAPARNRGLREAQGEWAAFLDDDDLWSPAKLRRQLAARAGAEAVCCNAVRIDAEGRPWGRVHAALPARLTAPDLAHQNRVVTSSVLVRREAALACGGFPENPGLKALEDFALWLRLALRAPWACLDEDLVSYRDAGPSLRAELTEDGTAQRRRVFLDLFLYGLHQGKAGALSLGALELARAWKRRAFP